MFKVFYDLCNKVLALDQYVILEEALEDPYVQAQIIELNQSQLYDKGIEADGSPTGEYSKKSIEVYGKSPGHITLKDTGATYDTMRVLSSGDGFVIVADMDLHGVDLNVIYPNALGLTPESLEELLPLIRDTMIRIIKDKLKIE